MKNKITPALPLPRSLRVGDGEPIRLVRLQNDPLLKADKVYVSV
jgi:hypothetical protein